MTASALLVVFHLHGQRYALPIEAVKRIVRAVEVTALPEAPAMVLGIIDAGGVVLPVLDFRQRLGLPGREIRTSDHFIWLQSSRREMVVPVDEALGVVSVPAKRVIETAEIVRGSERIKGVVPLADGLVLIQDVERFLSMDEDQSLSQVLEKEAAHGN